MPNFIPSVYAGILILAFVILLGVYLFLIVDRIIEELQEDPFGLLMGLLLTIGVILLAYYIGYPIAKHF